MEPGSFYTEPADAPHFALTQDEPATVYITGFGPTDTHYIDAAADPPTSLTLKRDPVVRPYRRLSACSKASASGPVSQQVIGRTMLKATGAEESIFKKAAGSYKCSRRLV